MATEVIRKGKSYRILTDAVNQIWDKISFWTHADDVYFDDGDTLSEKLGGGLITTLSEISEITSPGNIPDCLAIKDLNNSVTSAMPSFTYTEGVLYITTPQNG